MKKYNRIAIEGGEGVGKSTVLDILKEKLDPETTLFVKEPYEKSSVANDIIRWRKGELDLYEIEQTELMAKSRAELNNQVVIPAINDGKIVVFDRSIISNLVYQLTGTHLTRNEIIDINLEEDENMALPDLCVLIDADPRAVQDRLNQNGRERDAIDSKPLEFHYQIRDEFLNLSEDFPCDFLILSGFDDPEVNAEKILELLK